MMKKKTVAIVINTSWNIFNFRLGLLKALQEEGYRIVAVAPRDDYSEKLEALGFEYHEIKMNNKGTNPVEDAKLVYDFYRLYKKLSPDVILQYTIKPNIYGSMAAGMLGIPVVSNISGLGTVFLNDGLSSKIARMLYKIALRVPKKVFYQNAHDRELFVQSKLVKEAKTDLLPGSGIDTDTFKPLTDVKKDPEVVRFLFIARLVKDKGLAEFVEAARIIKNLEFTMNTYKKPEFHILGAYYPGNPTAITESEMRVWEEEGSVAYIGTSDDVQSVIAEADCVVLPSYREGLSRVLLEAASMAKPIITTNVPGCKEVVDEGINGYLCEVKDANSLAEQMKKMMLLSDDERRGMGKKGREKVMKEFDEKIVIEKYKKTIAELCS
ncbi:glycosyltransferase family 4 protein [Sulfurovum sp.]|uniref:glycosyltransferase family 4 protein n=1 Tax=Sulfurovum sp. TaxID=1969726 RepID=UPI0028683624|nr:glycosyltransferase family 4 protein [Sulfurovum sp.]